MREWVILKRTAGGDRIMTEPEKKLSNRAVSWSVLLGPDPVLLTEGNGVCTGGRSV